MPDAAAPFPGASDPHHVDVDNRAQAHRPGVVIVSSVRLFREGLAELVGRDSAYASIAMARDFAEVRACLRVATPVIALVDASDDDALDIAQFCSRAHNIIGVIAFATADDVDARILLAEAGVSGYVSRDGSIHDVMSAIERVRGGELEVSPRMAAALARRVASLAQSGPAGERAESLSYREREIVRLIDRGMSNKEIARTLSIEVATVKNHIHHILQKLGVSRRGEAAALLRRWQRTVATPRTEYSAMRTEELRMDHK